MKDQEFTLAERLDVYCPRKDQVKRCHSHTNPVRNFIHDIHCLVSGCYYNKFNQFLIEYEERK